MKFIRNDQTGFTLIEILIALAIFAIIVIGALGAIGAVNLGGLVEGLPTGFATSRVAKDYTAATVYLQGLNEYLACTLTQNPQTCEGTAPPPLDCDGTPLPCTLTRTDPPGGSAPFGYSIWPPPDRGYQLDWTRLTIRLEIWNWNGTQYVAGAAGERCDGTQYAASGSSSGDKLYMLRSTLDWSFKGTSRSICVERFIPYRPSIPIPNP